MKFGIAISSYKSDNSTISLIEKIYSEKWNVEKVIVVESLGSGYIKSFISDNDISNFVDYYNYNTNIGSAKNLQIRMEKAYELGLDSVLTLNHDAIVTEKIYDVLVKNAKEIKGAAFYSLKYFSNKRIFDLTGTKEPGVLQSFGPKRQPLTNRIPCIWSSSNVALYSTEPLSKNIKPNGSLWMGWEDYLYGLQLHKNGYSQYIVSETYTHDNYEFEQKRIMGKKIHLSDKPHWYYYYRGRNLLLITLYIEFSFVRLLRISIRLFLESIAILIGTLKNRPLKAVLYFVTGICHGITNKRGKWKVPN